MERRSFLLTIAALAFAGTRVQARTRTGISDFRDKDLMGGSFALTTSRVALTRSANPDIIDFANAEIAEQVQVAEALGAESGSVPLRPDHAALLSQLGSTPLGATFDRMYVQGQIRGHHELLALNDSYLRAGHNPQDQAVARMSLPIIHRHLAILNSLREIA